MPDEESEVVLNVRQAARLLSVHENTIRNWVKDGRLESVRLPGSRFHRFRQTDVEALAARRRRSDASLATARKVIGPELVDATQLHQWAERQQARGLFPLLIRRLLVATPGVSAISVRTAEGTDLSGWDGRARSTGSAYLPSGELLLEFGVGKAIPRKAQEDFDKRAAELGDDVADLTFVFVTPRRWAGGPSWAREQAKAGPFADVRVLDGDDIEGWLVESASVHYWISEELGRNPKDATTLERWWERFAGRTDPTLPEGLFLAGREQARQPLLQRLEKGPTAVAVTSAWREEALAFVYAALNSEPERELAQQALVIRTAEVWERTATQAEGSILIPLFSEPDTGLALRHGHSVIWPADREESFGATIDLGALNREGAREVLEQAGLPYDQAYSLSGRARRSMPSLVRRLARDPLFRRPRWSQGEDGASMAPLALVGGWTDSEADLEVVGSIAGASATEIERTLTPWLEVPDAPFLRSGGRWYLASREDASALLSSRLTRGQLQIWHEKAIEVLTESDPALELPLEERYIAGVRGKKRRFSGALRSAFAEGAAALGADRETVLPRGRTGAERAAFLVREVLGCAAEQESGELWAAISDQLPLLAEAAPAVFLDAVHDDLDRDEPTLRKLFQDSHAQSALFTSSPHTDLLWALESLAWSQEYFPSAVLALARLVAVDPGGRLSNRPLASLGTIMVIWIHQTSATLEQRQVALTRICDLDPDLGWQLVRLLWPRSQTAVSPPCGPRFHDWAPEVREVALEEWLDVVQHLVELAIKLAQDETERWCDLLQRLGPVPVAGREALLTALESALERGVFAGSETVIWERLGEEIARHRIHGEAHWSLSEETLERMETIRRTVEPEQDLERSRHLFTRWPEGEGLDKSSYSDYLEKLLEMRREALERIVEEQGLHGVEELVDRAEVPAEIGDLVSLLFSDRFEEEFLGWLAADDEARAALARGWATGEVQRKGSKRLTELLGQLPASATEERLTLLIAAGARASTWDQLASETTEVIERYWQTMDTWGIEAADVERAADELLERGRGWAVLQLLSAQLHSVEDEARPFADDVVLRALQVSLADKRTESLNASMAGYEVGVLLDYLVAGEVEPGLIASFEYAYFTLLEDYRAPEALYAELARTPELFVEFVQRVYRGAQEEPRQLSAEDETHAEQAWLVLHHWRSVPGLADDGSLDGEHLKRWVTDARYALSELDRADIGDEQIGQLLASSPEGHDGIWPPEPVRELIETLGSAHLETGVNIGRVNNRGITSRGVYAGGEQERDLAARYREWAAATRDEWRRTSRLLRELADEYDSDARFEDVRASVRSDLG